MREIAVLAEAEMARAREIAVFAEPPGGPAEAERASVREIALFAEAQVASAREIAVFAEPPGGLAEAQVASVREIAVFAEAQVASVREIAVFADVQVGPAPKKPERLRASHSNVNLYIDIYRKVSPKRKGTLPP